MVKLPLYQKIKKHENRKFSNLLLDELIAVKSHSDTAIAATEAWREGMGSLSRYFLS